MYLTIAADTTGPNRAAQPTDLLTNRRLAIRSCSQLVSTLKVISQPRPAGTAGDTDMTHRLQLAYCTVLTATEVPAMATCESAGLARGAVAVGTNTWDDHNFFRSPCVCTHCTTGCQAAGWCLAIVATVDNGCSVVHRAAPTHHVLGSQDDTVTLSWYYICPLPCSAGQPSFAEQMADTPDVAAQLFGHLGRDYVVCSKQASPRVLLHHSVWERLLFFDRSLRHGLHGKCACGC